MFRQHETLLIDRPRPVRPGARTGLVRNPLSRRNRGASIEPWWRDLAQPDLLRAEPRTPEDLAEALRDFARREVGLVVIDGGDGTVSQVLSALPQAYGDILPAVAVLAQGATNLIAADVGAGRSDPALLAQLSGLARTGALHGRTARRRILEVSWPDGSRPPVSGMFLGAGAFTRATELSFRLVRRGIVDEGAGIAATLLSAMAHTALGPHRARWLQGDRLRLSTPGGAAIEGPRFLLLATTLEKLMLGLWPFWGEGEGGLRYLDIDAPPRRLASALPSVMYGRVRPWMEAAGYRSGVAGALDLTLTEPFILDGEHFEPGPGGRVVVRAHRSMDFIVP